MEKGGVPSYVWYASYGSNIHFDRFMCYIQGGKPANCSEASPGCRDVTPPLKDKPFLFPLSLYFARTSRGWGGAPAFLDFEEKMDFLESDKFEEVVKKKKKMEKILEGKGEEEWGEIEVHDWDYTLTYGRMYLITSEQFFDVVKQENCIRKEDFDFFDFQMGKWKSNKITQLFGDHQSYYNYLIYLGEEEGFPIFSFTGRNTHKERGMKTSLAYLKTISIGLREKFKWDEVQLANYFMTKYGVFNHFSYEDLIKALKA
eukprot:TRINITY_DN5451_c0_g1_i1.p1 TRINITY_DN5451_c0_g1~~TRINITY_DN5451_c0_g1_i1.p1  ORF type:complete len:258 (+),score=61.61 TRINITY_DN5451_c0_g1_i1:209-982(+)